MAAHLYWRLTGFLTDSNALELSQAQLYDGAQLIAQAPTFTVPPTAGTAFPETLRWDDCTMPGFALAWTLATPVDSPLLRLGAGGGADTFPKELYCQHSDDGKLWSTSNSPINIAFPGTGLLTTDPATGGGTADPEFAKVSLLLRGGLVDVSLAPKTVTAFNGAVASSPAKFGAVALKFNGSSRVEAGVASDFVFGGDFTLEGWVYPTANPDGFAALLDFRPPATNGLYPLVYLNAARKLVYFLASAETIVTANTCPLSAWTHWALCRASGQTRLFLAGLQAGSTFADARSYPEARACFGASGENSLFGRLTGSLDELRITNGFARYTGPFTPPAAPFLTAGGAFIPASTTPAATRLRAPSVFAQNLPGSALPEGATRGHLREHTFMDAYHGGRGVIRSTVKQKDTPVNTPLRRRVLLIDERSQLTIRETWSDVVTGNYEFTGIREDFVYTITSYDHLHDYRAVVADNLTLANGGVELML